jgi:hypothetical protein
MTFFRIIICYIKKFTVFWVGYENIFNNLANAITSQVKNEWLKYEVMKGSNSNEKVLVFLGGRGNNNS